jgi:hypothetical protein
VKGIQWIALAMMIVGFQTALAVDAAGTAPKPAVSPSTQEQVLAVNLQDEQPVTTSSVQSGAAYILGQYEDLDELYRQPSLIVTRLKEFVPITHMQFFADIDHHRNGQLKGRELFRSRLALARYDAQARFVVESLRHFRIETIRYNAATNTVDLIDKDHKIYKATWVNFKS